MPIALAGAGTADVVEDDETVVVAVADAAVEVAVDRTDLASLDDDQTVAESEAQRTHQGNAHQSHDQMLKSGAQLTPLVRQVEALEVDRKTQTCS